MKYYLYSQSLINLIPPLVSKTTEVLIIFPWIVLFEGFLEV